jgi:mono/diheme cytochrome c family protein
MGCIVRVFLRSVLPVSILGAIAVAVVIGCSTSSADAPSPALIQLGVATYQESCVSCHGDPVTGEGRVEGFALAPIHGPGGHTWHHADGQLLDLIQGRITYPDRIMPKFGGLLPDADVLAVLEFLKLGWTDRQRESQREVSVNWERLSE